MDAWVAWWVVSTLIGVVALPYCSAAFAGLPDRGWCFARPLGLLLTSYVLWLTGVVGLLPNGRGAALLSVIAVGIGALLLLRNERQSLAALVRKNGRALLVYEVVYLVAFGAMALLRAQVPELDSTEKPMDLAMLTSAMRSPTLPPLDPWLSGFTVNYYYFGYLMMGVLSQLAGTAASVGFNLALAYLFAAAAMAVLGLVANLVTLLGRADDGGHRISRPALRAGGLGTVMLLVAGNLVGGLELLRAHGFNAPDLWRWLSIKLGDDGAGHITLLGVSPDRAYQSVAWYPTENWWWWRSTRVVDSVFQGRSTDYTITEFPFFSFLLGDLHPHVMALPFGMMALGVCLAAFYRVADPLVWLREHRIQAAITVLTLGSLGFINGWDLGPYLALFCGTVAARTWLDNGAGNPRAWARFAVGLCIAGLAAIVAFGLFYLPLVAQVLTSGAGGTTDGGGPPIALWQGPNTRPLHFLVFWFAAIALCAGFLMALIRGGLGRWGVAAGSLLGAILVLLVGAEVWHLLNPDAPSDASPFRLVTKLWLLAPLTIALVAVLRRSPRHPEEAEDAADGAPPVQQPLPDAARFVAGLFAAALLLLLVSELFYVRDVFGNRMNTVFKLWYQAWGWLAVVGAFGLAFVRKVESRGLRTVSTAVGLAAVALTGLYAVAATPARTEGFSKPATLDGLDYLKRGQPDEADALSWLAARPAKGEVLLEATGGQYSFFGRAATVSGIPTVLGWAGHERQWRGSDRAFQGRPADIDAIFNAADKSDVQGLLAKYGVTYVYVGSLEKGKYPKSALDAFANRYSVSYENPTVTIYRVSEPN